MSVVHNPDPVDVLKLSFIKADECLCFHFRNKIPTISKMNVVDMLQKQFQDSATNLQSVQKEYSKTLADRQTLDSQLNENKQVEINN